MDRKRWMKRVGFSLVIVVLLAGSAWADPTGSANVAQIMEGFTHTGTPSLSRQRTFLTTDSIIFEAIYYDPNPACVGLAPASTQLLVFNLEGRLILAFPASAFATSLGTKYRALFKDFASVASIPLGPGVFRWTYLVTDCTGAFQIALPDVPTFSVFAP
jgi:hypothetical protein